MNNNIIEETAKKYAEEKGKGEFGLVYSAFKQGAGWMETMVMRENEELKAINAELLKVLKVLIKFCSFIPKETFTESGKNDFQALLKNGTDVISKATK